jgi:serine/threonine protein kinase/Skp family chaperone for outer membrane proteins
MDDLDHGTTLKGFSPGQKVFQRYTLQKMLGRGGMGVVWLARDDTLARDVALKFLPEIVASDPTAIDDLKREVRRAIDLAHPHIVKTNDFVTDGRIAAVAMEYAPSGTLAQRRLDKSARVLSTDELRPWLEQLVGALDYAHSHAELVHRDLKPSNLMLDARDRLKVVDFGIAASISDSVSRVSKQAGASGTPVYMSPQQMMGEKPAVTDDIYSVGATLYELLTGKPPFHSGNILAQVQAKVPPPMAVRRGELGVQAAPIPAAWEAAVAACLAKDPAERPQTARAILARIDAVPVPAAVPRAAAPVSPTTTIRPSSAGRLALVASAMGFLVVGGLVWWAVARSPSPAPEPVAPAPSPGAVQTPPMPVPAPATPVSPSPAPVAAPGIKVSLGALSSFGQPWIIPTASHRRREDGTATVPLSGARVRVVDLAQRYDADERTIRSNVERQQTAKRDEDRLVAMNLEGRKLVERYKEAVAMTNDTALPNATLVEAFSTAQRLYDEIKAREREMKDYRQATQEQLQRQADVRRAEIMRALVSELGGQGTAAGVDLLLDKSGTTKEGISAVVYVAAALEMTDEGVATVSPPRVELGVVDLSSLVAGHPKSAEAKAKLDATRASADIEVRRQEQEIAGLRAAGDTAAFERKESELNTFRSNVDRSIAQRAKTMRDLLSEEVAVLVGQEAGARNLTLVLDRGAAGGDGERLVLDAGAAPDLTEAVRARIAADAHGA